MSVFFSLKDILFPDLHREETCFPYSTFLFSLKKKNENRVQKRKTEFNRPFSSFFIFSCPILLLLLFLSHSRPPALSFPLSLTPTPSLLERRGGRGGGGWGGSHWENNWQYMSQPRPLHAKEDQERTDIVKITEQKQKKKQIFSP
eukprot:Hpha_TRINITY_DN16631_c1_g3::TRINITY_DN16631_c1_g3_i2::g.178901::m.178901